MRKACCMKLLKFGPFFTGLAPGQWLQLPGAGDSVLTGLNECLCVCDLRGSPLKWCSLQKHKRLQRGCNTQEHHQRKTSPMANSGTIKHALLDEPGALLRWNITIRWNRESHQQGCRFPRLRRICASYMARNGSEARQRYATICNDYGPQTA